MITRNIWSSIVVLTKQLIAEMAAEYPNSKIEFIDWEAHANINELPNCDLVGPTAMTITEHSPSLVSVSFAIGVSTYQDDKNLFRHRDYIGRVFERLRPESTFSYFDSEASLVKSVLIATDGTMLSPMTKSESRPWQYVQCECLLQPVADQ